jgi:hypothetical protein
VLRRPGLQERAELTLCCPHPPPPALLQAVWLTVQIVAVHLRPHRLPVVGCKLRTNFSPRGQFSLLWQRLLPCCCDARVKTMVEQRCITWQTWRLTGSSLLRTLPTYKPLFYLSFRPKRSKVPLVLRRTSQKAEFHTRKQRVERRCAHLYCVQHAWQNILPTNLSDVRHNGAERNSESRGRTCSSPCRLRKWTAAHGVTSSLRVSSR